MHCSFLNLSETVNLWGDVGTACLQNDFKRSLFLNLPVYLFTPILKHWCGWNSGSDHTCGHFAVRWLPFIGTEIREGGDLHSQDVNSFVITTDEFVTLLFRTVGMAILPLVKSWHSNKIGWGGYFTPVVIVQATHCLLSIEDLILPSHSHGHFAFVEFLGLY